MAKKKLNPRHVPVSARSLSMDAIVDDAMKDDMLHAWLLVADTLLEHEQISSDEINEMYSSFHDFETTEASVRHAERLMGTSKRPSPDIGPIATAADLKKLKARMKDLALHTALCMICLNLEESGRFTEEDLKRIFLAADITRAEIERGDESYGHLEDKVLEQKVNVR